MVDPVKFTFDTVFDVDDTDDDGSGVKISQIFSREELNAACEEARQAGIAEGTAQEHARIERRHADALNTIAERLANVADTQATEINRVIEDGTKLALAIARKIAPEFMRRQPLAEIEAMIAEHLMRLVDEPRVVVRAPDDLLDEIKSRIEGIVAGCGYTGRIVLLADPSLRDSDCHMEWADGGAERDTDAVWRDIETAIERLLHTPPEYDGVVSTATETGNPAQVPVAPATPDAQPAADVAIPNIQQAHE